MTIDEKIANLLNRINSKPINQLIDLIDYRLDLECNEEEFKEIISRLERENYVKPAVGYTYTNVFITDIGKDVGRNNTYLKILSEREKESDAKERQVERDLDKERRELTGKRIDRIITCISVLGTLAIGIWSTSINEDMKDVKISMDSVQVRIQDLKFSIDTLTRKLDKLNSPINFKFKMANKEKKTSDRKFVK